jgi:hypothetical protein
VRDPATLSKFLLLVWEKNFKPEGKKPTERAYRGVTIKEVPLDPGKFWSAPVKALFQGTVDKGYYLSWNEGALKRRIDTVLSRRKAKPGKTEAVHAALYLAPPRGKAGEALGGKTWGAEGSRTRWRSFRSPKNWSAPGPGSTQTLPGRK